MLSKQTLFIPERINIELRNKKDEPLHQPNIFIGIRTMAFHTNDIDLSPFLSDAEGRLSITKDQIEEAADNFISYGLMDYVPLIYAKPGIEIYFKGSKNINIYLGQEVQPE